MPRSLDGPCEYSPPWGTVPSLTSPTAGLGVGQPPWPAMNHIRSQQEQRPTSAYTGTSRSPPPLGSSHLDFTGWTWSKPTAKAGYESYMLTTGADADVSEPCRHQNCDLTTDDLLFRDLSASAGFCLPNPVATPAAMPKYPQHQHQQQRPLPPPLPRYYTHDFDHGLPSIQNQPHSQPSLTGVAPLVPSWPVAERARVPMDVVGEQSNRPAGMSQQPGGAKHSEHFEAIVCWGKKPAISERSEEPSPE